MRRGGFEAAVAMWAMLATAGCDRLLALAPVPDVDAAKPPGDVAAAYAFDDPAGSVTLTDGSGNGNTAQLVGPVFGAGKYATALQLDGDDRAVVPNSASLDITGTAITIALWLRIDPMPDGDQVIVGKPWGLQADFVSPYYQYGIEFRRAETALVFFAGDSQEQLHQSAALAIPTPDVLRHYAFTYDGTSIRAYLDGVEYSNVSTTASLVSRDTPLLIGTDGRNGQGLHGAIDNLRIYRRALDAAEIASDMNLAALARVRYAPAGG